MWVKSSPLFLVAIIKSARNTRARRVEIGSHENNNGLLLV